ncbi:carcinoembryonic antigen-related cell adhesion molecule 20-like isoform X2 [Clupea harengus]|uniref:Carcinoembryonic antigen-related cell adhesion molecule 20-like isoform X2 n=1 Tax=Clupea harengus TaxID=7950 RepID=A0A6P8G0S9_CLUHA|nr:carcinoembryonic antigen-related cell adhesion molecule 20-like isoform X2 [Clupea harengus]
MEYLLFKTTAFLLLGFCSCQNELLLNGPLDGAVGGSVKFTLINPPSATPTRITWHFKGNREVTIVTSLGDREDIHADYVGRISVDKTTASLELRGLTLNDTGLYTVSITISGVESRGETSLTVFAKVSTPTIESSGGTLIAGNSSVTLTSGQGTIITRAWTKGGQPLSPSNRTTFSEENRTLSISPVESGDNGQYTCTVNNLVSSARETHTLEVNYGPHNVHISPLDVVTSGDRVSLECLADSVPTASLTWMFNGSETGSDSQLIIDKVDHSHAGKYTCTAWNSVTRLTASAEQMLHVTEDFSAHSSPLSGGAIAGIVIGSVAGAGVVAGVIAFGLKMAEVW